MTHDEAFLRDIQEHPEDDAPRLIYADWLEDRGGSSDAERAEFIRVQCELARLPGGASDEHRERLRARVQQLLHEHWEGWGGPLARLLGHQKSWPLVLGSHHFQRGFLETLRVPTQFFLSRAEELFRLTPLRHLQLEGAGALAGALAGCPYLARLETLHFVDYYSDPIDAAGMRALAGSPHLGRLTALRLYSNNLGDEGVRALAGAPWLAGLRVLDLGNNGLSAEGVAALAGTPHPFRPEFLALGRNAVGDAGLGALAVSPVLTRVKRLFLSNNAIGHRGASALARSPHLGRLQYLDLDNNPLGDAGALALAGALWRGGLAELHIDNCQIGSTARHALLASRAVR
jgi:uncharacterized protein (TIGR02996 family)